MLKWTMIKYNQWYEPLNLEINLWNRISESYVLLKQIKLNGKEGNVAYLLDDVEYVAFEIW